MLNHWTIVSFPIKHRRIRDVRYITCSPWELYKTVYNKNTWKQFWPIQRIMLINNWSCFGAESSINKLTLVPSKSYKNEAYSIPFDVSQIDLQHGIFGFSVMNSSPYPSGSFHELVISNIVRFSQRTWYFRELKHHYNFELSLIDRWTENPCWLE
jgi:hypothetical protein